MILNGVEIKTSNEEKLPGVPIDKDLSFDVHIKSICKKRQAKRHVPLLD